MDSTQDEEFGKKTLMEADRKVLKKFVDNNTIQLEGKPLFTRMYDRFKAFVLSADSLSPEFFATRWWRWVKALEGKTPHDFMIETLDDVPVYWWMHGYVAYMPYRYCTKAKDNGTKLAFKSLTTNWETPKVASIMDFCEECPKDDWSEDCFTAFYDKLLAFSDAASALYASFYFFSRAPKKAVKEQLVPILRYQDVFDLRDASFKKILKQRSLETKQTTVQYAPVTDDIVNRYLEKWAVIVERRKSEPEFYKGLVFTEDDNIHNLMLFARDDVEDGVIPQIDMQELDRKLRDALGYE